MEKQKMLHNLLVYGPRVAAATAMLLSLAITPAYARGSDDEAPDAMVSSSPSVAVSARPMVSPTFENKSGRGGRERGERIYSEDSGRSRSESPVPTTSPIKGVPEVGAQASGKLDAKRLAVCEKNKPKAERLMARVASRGEAQSKKIAAVSQRVQDFYVTQGSKVANYQALVTASGMAAAKVDADIAALRTQGTIECTGDNVGGGITGFKTSTKTLTADLQAYRASVKALIIAVRSANPETSPSTKPVSSPIATPVTSASGNN